MLDPDLVGFDFTFGPEGGEMLSLQAIKRDGTKSQRFGSNSGHGIALSGAVQGSYRLASADYEIIGNNIAAISFEYKFAPEVTTIKAESVGAILNGAAITTVPLQINGKSMFAAKNITTPSMEVLVLRAHDGAVRFHKEYSLHVHWAKAPYALQWDQFYEDVTKQAQAGAPNDILIMSLLNTSGLAYPPTNVCNFLVKVGAGPALEKWVNSPSWHNSSDASFGSIAYLLGGHFNSGESKGFEKLLHGQAVKASMKLYLHAGKLQENPPQLNQKVV